MVSPEPAGDKGCILAIDDDILLLKTLKKLLQKQGYQVETAQGGEEGIQKAKTGYFHLILCDIRMPGLDGIMTLRHIKDFQEKAGLGRSGLVIISAYGSEENYHKAKQLGVTEFVSKPFDNQKFLETVCHHIEPLVEKTPMSEVAHLNRKLDMLLASLHRTESNEKVSG